MTPAKPTSVGMSIGAVAKQTGISIESLRKWERRYGFPRSIRLASGHRRYTNDEVRRLVLAAKAIDAGFRAGQVASATIEEIKRMLEAVGADPAAPASAKVHLAEVDAHIQVWMRAALAADEKTLTDAFCRDWAELGALGFIDRRAIPYIKRIGDAWFAGEISVADEHFACEKLCDFLSATWRRQNEHCAGAPLLLASLPGDFHRVGLLMCAVVATAAQRRVHFLGSQTPPREIVRTAKRVTCAAVCISISRSIDRIFAERALLEIRQSLPDTWPLVTGGEGSPEDTLGTVRMTDFREFFDWVRLLPQDPA